MTGAAAIQQALGGSQWIFNALLAGFSDDDYFVRPVPGANTTAWQIGHLIESEKALVQSQLPEAKYPDFPAGFLEAHSKEGAKRDDRVGFLNGAGYLELFEKVRAATMAVVAGLTDAELDRPSQGDMAKFAPNLGAFLILVSNHTLMHAGQFSVVRRKLGKPIAF